MPHRSEAKNLHKIVVSHKLHFNFEGEVTQMQKNLQTFECHNIGEHFVLHDLNQTL